MRNLIDQFKAVRRVGTPLVAVSTSNQGETIRKLSESNGAPMLRWDIVRGLAPLNKSAESVLATILGDNSPEMTGDPVVALEMIERVPDRTVVFFVNAHRFVDDSRVSTGVGNLRDEFKSKQSTLVLLGPSFRLPSELTQDVILLSDALPDDEELSAIVDSVAEAVRASDAEFEDLDDVLRDNVVAALRGLSTFGAEQQTFLSLKRNGGGKLTIDLDSLWARKIEAINAIPGLEMRFEKKDRDSIRGLDSLMTFFDRIFRAENPERPRAIVHIDEIDKALAASGAGGNLGDSSGVTQDQIGQFLQTMEDQDWDGLIPVGPPGTGKTLVSKTVAGIHGVPYIRLDLGAMKGSLVGESEERIRLALETIDRIGGGRVFVLATCNKLDALPPELKRRFASGIWYFDLPDADGRAAIWKLYLAKYDLDGTETDVLADSDNWTGAEIRNACRSASRLGIELGEAMTGIVPVYLSGADDLKKLRSLASGRFLDATGGGTYRAELAPVSGKSARKIEV